METNEYKAFAAEVEEKGYMTVGELIESLRLLEQDKKIWVLYDGYSARPPIFQRITDRKEVFNHENMQVGEYYFDAS